jgi:two-component system chemotaxis response regulator CheB
MPDRDVKAATLLTQVRLMSAVKVDRRQASFEAAARGFQAPIQAAAPLTRLQIVAVGGSTGGPPALQTLLNALPGSFPAPIVVVQHIARGFVSGLAAWISETTPFRCQVAEHGDTLAAGQVYLAPDSHHFTVTPDNQVCLDTSPPQKGLRPSINRLFESTARSFGSSAAGVLLTGMGQDGAQGLLAMRQAGAFTIAQDESSSLIFGMPKAAIDLRAACEVLPLGQIGLKLNELGG